MDVPISALLYWSCNFLFVRIITREPVVAKVRDLDWHHRKIKLCPLVSLPTPILCDIEMSLATAVALVSRTRRRWGRVGQRFAVSRYCLTFC
jgi:hypothetical protein